MSPGDSLADLSRKKDLEIDKFADDSKFLRAQWKGLGGEEG